nr:MAG TPA: hypothetical protein [Caudoviricetes sp.]
MPFQEVIIKHNPLLEFLIKKDSLIHLLFFE